MKGILLAGGSGTRLYPITKAVCKQLLPLYDKPMVYYPLSVLLLAGIKEILIITTPDDQKAFQHLLGDGSQWGIGLSYVIQEQPNGLAQALILGEQFLAGDHCTLILGDNIFFGHGLAELLTQATAKDRGATVFGYRVNDPQRYGVPTFDAQGVVTALHEKPKNPASNYAITGLYVYDQRAVEFAKSLQPSKRGELEITDLNRVLAQERVFWYCGRAVTYSILSLSEFFLQSCEQFL